jgi:hypothetical protein
MSFQSGPSPRVYDPDRERGNPPMRNVAASLFLSLAGADEQPDEFVTDVDDATEANLRGVSR